MDHATCFRLLSATHFATSLLPLTVRLIPVLTEIGHLIVGFRRAELTPQVGRQFETQLHAQLRELGRIIVAWTFNHIEPRDRRDMPNQMCFQGVWYRRRSKTPNRKVATLFGTITLWRYLYQPLHGVGRKSGVGSSGRKSGVSSSFSGRKSGVGGNPVSVHHSCPKR
jgi:hypothetical protein